MDLLKEIERIQRNIQNMSKEEFDNILEQNQIIESTFSYIECLRKDFVIENGVYNNRLKIKYDEQLVYDRGDGQGVCYAKGA